MYIIVSTPTETFITDIPTMQLYTAQGKLITKGFLRIMAAMWHKNIAALEKYDNGKLVQSWHSRKCKRVFA